MKRNQLAWLSLAASVWCFAPAWTQTAARVTGTVRSSAGAAIAGAKITAAVQDRGDQSEAVTDENGAFALPQLPPGSYQISAAAPGYSEYAVVVEVGAGQTRTVEMSLNGLEESTVIAVSKDAAAADLSSARLSVNVSPVEVTAMPLNGRTYSILTLLAPGAANRGDGGFDKLTFGGQPNRFNRYNFDGIDAGSVIDPNPGWFPVVGTQFRLQTSIETIQEFRVDSALQPAEYGVGAGAHVNLVSRSGGGELHGSVFEYFRHDALASRDFFAPDSGRLRMNQYGAAAGGPIPRMFGKDRAFFFAAFEKLAQSSRVGGQSVVPTPLLLSILHPATRQFVATMPATPGPDPASLLSLADRSGLSRLAEWNASARLDFDLAPGQRLALRYVKAREGLDTLDQTTVTPRYLLAHAAPDNAMASWNSVWGAAFNELKFGMNRAPTGLAYATPFAWMNEIGVLPGAQLAAWMFGGVGRQAGGDYGRASDYRGRTYAVMDSASVDSGRHTVKAGLELRAIRMPLSMLGGTVYSFSTPGFIANLGATASYTGDLRAEARQDLYSFFVQDEWRVRRNLSINAGLRYEYYTPVRAADGRARVFDMGRLDYLPAGSAFYTARGLGLAPRLGLAWAPARLNSRTIVRIGGAIHYSPGQLRDFLGPIENSATRFSVGGVSYPADLSAAASTVQNPLGIDAGARFPERVYQWGLSVQQVLPARFTAEAAYLGSAGRNLITRRWGNLIAGMTPCGSLARQNPGVGEVAYVAGGGSENYHSLQLRLSRRFTDDLQAGIQYSWSHNIADTQSDDGVIQDPLCLRCEKGPVDFDVRHSAVLNAHYRIPLGRGARRWNRGAVGYLMGGWSAGAMFNVRSSLPVNVVLQRGDVAFLDAGGQVVPVGTPGARPALDTLYGGGSRGTLRPGVAAGVNPYLGGRLQVFNPAAFTVPAMGTYGNLGRNALRGPGFSQLDLQVTRTFRIGERSALDFRADCYNLANHPNFAQPSAMLVNVSPLVQPGGAFDMSQSQNFGVISSTIGRNLGLGAARQTQLGLRFSF